MRSRQTTPFLVVLLFGLVVWAFLPAVRHGFINLDDGVYVYDNDHVKSGMGWANIRWASIALYFGIWHLLTWSPTCWIANASGGGRAGIT